jgi:hypothetical protein
MEVLQQHVNAPVPVLPPDLVRYDSLIKRLLAKSRAERFPNAAEIVAAVAAVRTPAGNSLELINAHANGHTKLPTGERPDAPPESGEAQPTAA